jgi:hypothetical protein
LLEVDPVADCPSAAPVARLLDLEQVGSVSPGSAPQWAFAAGLDFASCRDAVCDRGLAGQEVGKRPPKRQS